MKRIAEDGLGSGEGIDIQSVANRLSCILENMENKNS